MILKSHRNRKNQEYVRNWKCAMTTKICTGCNQEKISMNFPRALQELNGIPDVKPAVPRKDQNVMRKTKKQSWRINETDNKGKGKWN